MGLQSGIETGRVCSALDAGARRPVLLASILLAALLALMAFGVAQAQDPGISLVNETANVVERRKDGGFIARPVFDRRLAFLAYAVRDPDSGDWLTGVTQVRGGENKLSDGWEYTWEYPAYNDQPLLDPERVYVLFMMGAETSPGEPEQFHVVVPVHQPTGLWDRVIGSFDPSRWARAFARWIIEGVHGGLCGVVERATGDDAENCRGG